MLATVQVEDTVDLWEMEWEPCPDSECFTGEAFVQPKMSAMLELKRYYRDMNDIEIQIFCYFRCGSLLSVKGA
jgi:hypothetical protein